LAPFVKDDQEFWRETRTEITKTKNNGYFTNLEFISLHLMMASSIDALIPSDFFERTNVHGSLLFVGWWGVQVFNTEWGHGCMGFRACSCHHHCQLCR